MNKTKRTPIKDWIINWIFNPKDEVWYRVMKKDKVNSLLGVILRTLSNEEIDTLIKALNKRIQ
jgi:hypothetical protein